jgi:tellurite resistance protein TehA-like permease
MPVWTVSLTCFTVIVLVKRNTLSARHITPSIFLPLISVMTLGTTGGIVCRYGVGMSARIAVPLFVMGYMAIGYAFGLSLVYYAFLAHKLMAVGVPEKSMIPTLVITVGSLGQLATTVQMLSTAASTGNSFAGYGEGLWLQGGAASSVAAVAVLVVLMAAGGAVLWIGVAWYVVLERLVRRDLPFGLTWWSWSFRWVSSYLLVSHDRFSPGVILLLMLCGAPCRVRFSFLLSFASWFPSCDTFTNHLTSGVFTTALLNLSIALNSPAFRGFVAALLVFLLIIYFANWAGTLWRTYQGIAPQRGEEDQQAREKNERYVFRSGNASDV